MSNTDDSHIQIGSREEFVEGLLDLLLGFAIQGRRGFIEDQQLRLLDESSSNRHSLLLAARQLGASKAYLIVQLTGKLPHQLFEVGLTENIPNLLICCVLFPHSDVLSNASVEEHGLLSDDANSFSELLLIDFEDRPSAEEHLALRRGIEFHQKLRNCRLP